MVIQARDTKLITVGDTGKKTGFPWLEELFFDIVFDDTSISDLGYEILVHSIEIEHTVDSISKLEVNFVSNLRIDDKVFYDSKEIELIWGYSSRKEEYQSLGKFYIVGIETSFSSGTLYTKVVGFSKEVLLSLEKRMYAYESMRHSDIASMIAKRYGFKEDVSVTTDQFERIVQIDENDYRFLKKIAISNSYLFFVQGDTLVFKHVLDFPVLNTEIRFLDEEQFSVVQRMSFSLDKFGLLKKVTQRVEGPTGSEIELGGRTQEINIEKNEHSAAEESYPVKSTGYISGITRNVAEMANLVDAINLFSSFVIQGHVETIGIPEIVAGRFIDIIGVGRVSGRFFITSARHSIRQDINQQFKYRTDIKVIKAGIGDSQDSQPIGEEFIDIIDAFRKSTVEIESAGTVQII